MQGGQLDLGGGGRVMAGVRRERGGARETRVERETRFREEVVDFFVSPTGSSQLSPLAKPRIEAGRMSRIEQAW